MGESPVRVEIEGLSELTSSLGRLASEVDDFSDTHTKTGRYIAGQAAGRAPKRTGRLAGSGRVEADSTASTVKFGGPGIPYANPIHWGVAGRPGQRGPHNIRPTLFATKAASQSESTWMPWYLAELQHKVDRVKGA